MTLPELVGHPAVFRRSSFCAKDACVEVAFVPGAILVRDGKDTSSSAPVLSFDPDEWSSFVQGVAAGEFSG